jgi:hypothetical protein
MPNTSSSKNHCQDQPELTGPIPKSHMGKSEDNKKVTFFPIQSHYPIPQNNRFSEPYPFLE